MTACTNHGGKARRVVTAALVGVLSVGTVPMVALAEGVNDGISTLALSSTDAFKMGSMTEAENEKGQRLDIPSDGIVTVSQGHWVVPTEVTPKDGKPVDIRTDANKDAAHPKNASISYSGDGITGSKWASQVTSADFQAPGKYTATITLDDDPAATLSVDFFVEEAKDLSDAVLFDNTSGANDPSDTTFTYNGKQQVIGVAIDGKVLKLDDGDPSNGVEDYNITVSQVTDGNGAPATSSTCQNAGTYTVTVNGATGSDYNLQTKKFTLTVDKLDLSTADVSIADVVKGSTVNVTKIVADGAELDTAVNTALKINATYSASETGAASAVVFAADGAPNITGRTTVEFNVVDQTIDGDKFFYGTTAKNDDFDSINTAGQLTFDLNEGESFKANRVYVTTDGTNKLPESYYTVTYADSKGNEVDAAALQNPGTYFVKVRVNAAASHYLYGSATEQIKVVVTRGTMLPSDVVFKFDGEVGSSFNPTYSGEDQLAKLETIVHTQDGGADLVEGTDYTVQAYNSEDEKVDSIVNAGSYTVKIELSTPYAGISDDDLTCDIVVSQLDLDYGVSVSGGDLTSYTYDKVTGYDPDGNPLTTPTTVWYLSYTGEDQAPELEFGYYTDADGKVALYTPANASKLTWHALPEGSVEVTGYMYDDSENFVLGNSGDTDVVNGLGTYKVQFSLEDGNYNIPSGVTDDLTENYFTVSDKAVAFADVDANAWYAKAVFQAKQLGYVSGVSGTNLYAPEAKITRADALVIISRMAGFDQTVNAEDYLDDNGGFVTRYVDVDKGAYYAKAVAWGTKVGIVSGYQDGSGKFGPNDPITREQFAAMLCNYAKATGDDVATDGSALAALPDASTVSDWAESAVAWAVDAGVMGNNGSVMGQNQITRGEVAAMAVNYQPEGAGSGVIG